MAISDDVTETLAAKLAVMLPYLDERQRRLYLGSEARALGFGGIAAVARAAGVSELTVSAGVSELEAGAEPAPGRSRRAGGGRKKAEEKDPGLIPALEALLEDSTRGDPMSPLRWTTKSAENLAGELTRQGHRCRKDAVLRMLHQQGYSTQANSMTIEGRQHPDRDAQFRYIGGQAREFLAAGDPVISVDAKKKEQVGQYAQQGREWRPKGDPVRVRDHDFPDKKLGKVTPYGVYDIGANAGFVNVGTDHDTAAFAVESLRRWWRAEGAARYPGARRLLATADAGGSNGYRTRAWKAGLAGLAAETGLEITVLHFPPGTSKWNKIEHRLFSQITRNWRARPLVSHQVILETIAATATRTGLRVTAMLDDGRYPKKAKVSGKAMQELEQRVIARHGFHGEWNYTLLPSPRPAPRPAPGPGPAPAASRCDQAALNHPALTGMEPAALTALAAAIEVPFAARREQRLYQRRGGPRRGSARAGGHNRKLDLTDHVLATRMRQHLDLPPAVIGALLGADGTTISHITSRTAPLLDAQPPQPAAPAPGIRLRTLDDLHAYAAAAGLTLTIPPQPPATPRPRKHEQPNPDTPKLKADVHQVCMAGTSTPYARRPGRPAYPAGYEPGAAPADERRPGRRRLARGRAATTTPRRQLATYFPATT
jgi:transposase